MTASGRPANGQNTRPWAARLNTRLFPPPSKYRTHLHTTLYDTTAHLDVKIHGVLLDFHATAATIKTSRTTLILLRGPIDQARFDALATSTTVRTARDPHARTEERPDYGYHHGGFVIIR